MTENEILAAINRHHWLVRDKGYEVVMTVLIGSQNYKLDSETSDIDTFTFILPSLEELATAHEPISGEFEVDDGKCMYKDIRLALNLLKKTSPNSIECFIGQYRIFSTRYKKILKKYLENDELVSKMVHCNYSHMLYAIAGMAHQLTKRNMSAGKRYSHALRLRSMIEIFTSTLDYKSLLKLLPRDYEEARAAKFDTRDLEYYNSGCELIAQYLENVRDSFEMSDYNKNIEKDGLILIKEFQKELMLRYLREELE